LSTTPGVKQFRMELAKRNIENILTEEGRRQRRQQEARRTGGGPSVHPIPEPDPEVFRW